MTHPLPTCTHCAQRVLPATDNTTGEAVLLDPLPVPAGPVQIMRLPQGLVAIDHITSPAPRQPAWQLHSRTCPNAPVPVPPDLSEDPGREQARGWRA